MNFWGNGKWLFCWTNAKSENLWRLVRQAQARVKAEIAVPAADPKIWLRSDPGKEREGDPGWSAPVKAALQSSGNAAMLASPEWNALWCLILKSLASFPDARKALVDAMQSFDSDKVVNAIPQ